MMTKRIMAVVIVLVAVCLLAALTPGLWAQPLQQQPTVTPPSGTDAPRLLTESQQTATVRSAMLGDQGSPRVRIDAPPSASSQGGLAWFTNQANFEAFNGSVGNVLKGIENYEEAILAPGTADAVDDPLESGVPNLPDGFPFPDGLTGLPNLIVQSNLSAGNPVDPNPRGIDALGASSNGWAGAVSDIVLANFLPDSLDLIFAEEKSGVGFNTLAFTSGNAVEVRVYSTTNELLGVMTTPANNAGTNFIGVWSPTPIGRINIYNPNGHEGGDNIQAWEEAGAPDGLLWFKTQTAFEAFNADKGNILVGTEDFEESTLGPANWDAFHDPLMSGFANFPDGFPFPDGMTGLPNMFVQSKS